MTSDRRRSPILPISVTVAALLGLYVAAYYATVTRREIKTVRGELTRWVEHSELHPEYRLPQLARACAPVHRLDQCIRPQYWQARAVLIDQRGERETRVPIDPQSHEPL